MRSQVTKLYISPQGHFLFPNSQDHKETMSHFVHKNLSTRDPDAFVASHIIYVSRSSRKQNYLFVWARKDSVTLMDFYFVNS